MQMPRAENNLIGIIYVKFDNVDAGIFLKNNILKNGMKECVPITAVTKTFSYSHKNKTVTFIESNLHLIWGLPWHIMGYCLPTKVTLPNC